MPFIVNQSMRSIFNHRYSFNLILLLILLLKVIILIYYSTYYFLKLQLIKLQSSNCFSLITVLNSHSFTYTVGFLIQYFHLQPTYLSHVMISKYV